MAVSIVLVSLIVFSATIFLFYKSKYEDEIRNLGKKDFPLKDFLALGYFVLDLFKYRFTTSLDNEIKEKYSQLFGSKKAYCYLRAHWANTITLTIMLSTLIMFYMIIMRMNQPFPVALAILPVTFISVIFLLKSEAEKKISRRNLLLRLDFVEILNKLILLINSGMIVNQAMNKIVEDNACIRPLYYELKLAVTEIKGGKSEIEAYEAFANRCRVPEIFRFTLLIIQNMKKGSAEFVSGLRILANESWLIRKSAAKELSEEATTKLLFPMIFMFVAIIIIVVTPAILAIMTRPQ